MAVRRLRVLFVINQVADHGGAERFAAGLAAHLPRDRIEPWLCCTRGGDERAVRALVDAGVRYVCLGRQGKLDVHRLFPCSPCSGGSVSTSSTLICSARTCGRAWPDGRAGCR